MHNNIQNSQSNIYTYNFSKEDNPKKEPFLSSWILLLFKSLCEQKWRSLKFQIHVMIVVHCLSTKYRSCQITETEKCYSYSVFQNKHNLFNRKFALIKFCRFIETFTFVFTTRSGTVSYLSLLTDNNIRLRN